MTTRYGKHRIVEDVRREIAAILADRYDKVTEVGDGKFHIETRDIVVQVTVAGTRRRAGVTR